MDIRSINYSKKLPCKLFFQASEGAIFSQAPRHANRLEMISKAVAHQLFFNFVDPGISKWSYQDY
jgi:hypothetical protein